MKNIRLRIIVLLLALAPFPAFAQTKIKQSTAQVVSVGPFVDSTDGVTGEDAFTVANVEFQWRQPYPHTSLVAHVTNGTFAADTDWTKNGFTISGGVANATTITADLEQTSPVVLIEFRNYEVCYDSTRSAGSVTAKVGGTAGTARAAGEDGCEHILAGGTELLEFTGAGFTGTLDNVTVWPKAKRLTAAASGSVNDLVVDEDGLWDFEITAADTALVGTHQLCAYLPVTFATFCQDFDVIAVASYAHLVEGDVTTDTANQAEHDATQAAVANIDVDVAAVLASAESLDTIVKNTATQRFVVTFFSGATRVTTLTAAGITCRVFLDGSQSAITVTDTTELEVSDATAPGAWWVTLDDDETNGDSGLLICSATGGLWAQTNFQPQH